MPKRLINLEGIRNCKLCHSFKSAYNIWHRDQWGRLGWYCHHCYNAIKYGERSISNIFLIKQHKRTCQGCGSNKTLTWWHKDRWTGRKDYWYCHHCYVCMDQMEQRGFV